MMNKHRMLRSGLVLIGAFFLSALIAFAQIATYKAQTPSTGVAGMAITGSFTLQDQAGKVFTEKDLRGQPSLIYFGFSSCPAICPTELQKMTVALAQAGTAGSKIQPLFITIDPARDTPKALASYVAQFSPRLRGLTGPQTQIEQAEKAFHVYARKVEDASLSDYTMDHSSYIYWLGADGKLIALYGPSSTAAEIAHALKKSAN